jgi:hypothetical protein
MQNGLAYYATQGIASFLKFISHLCKTFSAILFLPVPAVAGFEPLNQGS